MGCRNVSVEQFTAASEIAPIAAVTQRFNLLEQSSDELLALTRDTDVVFSPWFPTGLPSQRDGDVPSTLAAAIHRVRTTYGISLPQVSLTWLLHRSSNIVVIPGTSRPEHLAENILAAKVRLTATEFARLRLA